MKRIVVFLIKITRRLKHSLYPLLYSVFGFVSVCKHTPSCSNYAIQQVEEHGTILGLWRGLKKILTCYS